MSTTEAGTENLAQRLDVLESAAAIRDLASNYCHGFDKRDWDLFLSIWWEDCVWDIGPPFGVFEGHKGIEEAVHDVLWPAWDESHHFTTNHVIRHDGSNTAHCLCDVDCVGRLAGEKQCHIVGATYTDTLQRRAGVWKILRRDVEMHYFNPIPGAELSPPTQP